MDLALERGISLEQIGQMPEWELQRWLVYHKHKRLPTRRIEHYLAQIALMLSSGKNTLHDFMLFKRPPLDVAEEVATPAEAAQAVASMAGARVIDLRSVRRPDGY